MFLLLFGCFLADTGLSGTLCAKELSNESDKFADFIFERSLFEENRETGMQESHFPRVKLLIVDMDNTLCDTFHTLSVPKWKKVAMQLKGKGWGYLIPKIDKYFGRYSFVQSMRLAGMNKEQMQFAIEHYNDTDVASLKLFPDAFPLLELPIPKILLSRGHKPVQDSKIKHLQLRPYFEKIVIVDSFETKDKAIEQALVDYEIEPQEALIIGDRMDEEIAIGKRLNIPTVLVKRTEVPLTYRFKPDMIVHSLRTLVNKLKGLRSSFTQWKV